MSRAVLTILLTLACASPLAAQNRRPARPAPRGPAVTLRGFGDVGLLTFQAKDSFDAVFGTRSGPVFGGGAEVLFRDGLFVQLRASRVRKTGERVFVFDGNVSPLGIPSTLTMTPVQISGGYRLKRPRSRYAPYVGGGVGWYRVTETDPFADASERLEDTFNGYHVVGGVEVRLRTWLGVAGEAQWSTVPDALGTGFSSVGAAFGESNLGGVTARVRVLVGSW